MTTTKIKASGRQRLNILDKLIRAALKQAQSAIPGTKNISTFKFQGRKYPLTVMADGEVIVHDPRGGQIVSVFADLSK